MGVRSVWGGEVDGIAVCMIFWVVFLRLVVLGELMRTASVTGYMSE